MENDVSVVFGRHVMPQRSLGWQVPGRTSLTDFQTGMRPAGTARGGCREDEASVPLFSHTGPSAEGTDGAHMLFRGTPASATWGLSTQIPAASGGGVDSGRLWGLETVRMILRSSWIWELGQKHVCSVHGASRRRHHPVHANGRSPTCRLQREADGAVRPRFQ